MPKFPVPNIIISKCLGFDSCRYNGQMLNEDFVDKLKPFVKFMPVCAEVEIGLGVPRFPVRIVSSKSGPSLVQPSTGKDVTTEMSSFASSFLSKINDADGFILKSRSPSCGLKDVRIYRKPDAPEITGTGPGLFGGASASSFPHLAIEDEGRLHNYSIREHFLSKLYALASLRPVRSMGSLVEFHSRNKFLLMSYGQKPLLNLGNIVANHKKLPPAQAISEYRREFGLSLTAPPKASGQANTLMHIFGFFSKTLYQTEKKFFMETLSMFREGRIPASSAFTILRAWAIRDSNDYILQQSIFSPYPPELMPAADISSIRL